MKPKGVKGPFEAFLHYLQSMESRHGCLAAWTQTCCRMLQTLVWPPQKVLQPASLCQEQPLPASWDATAPYHQALLDAWVSAGGAVTAAFHRDDQWAGMAVWHKKF